MRNLEYGVEEPTARTNYIGSQANNQRPMQYAIKCRITKWLQENKSGLPTRPIPVAFHRVIHTFLYLYPRDR